jgi:uncharacterized protein
MTDSMPLSDARYSRLAFALRPLESVVVAYSGGVDSTLVVKAAADVLGAKNVLAATGQSASLAPREQEAGHRVLNQIGLGHRYRIIPTGEQEIAEYRQNQPDRCFHCKTELYTHLVELARREGYRHVANGANLDDLGDYRPGMDAARDFEVKSPLLEAKLTKADVRDLARALGLSNWDKPAAPCLASRVPHGSEVNPGKLLQIAQAEAYLADLGLSGFRVRHHGDLARIELGPDAWEFFESDERRRAVELAFQNFGFRFVAVDLGGYRLGKAVIR